MKGLLTDIRVAATINSIKLHLASGVLLTIGRINMLCRKLNQVSRPMNEKAFIHFPLSLPIRENQLKSMVYGAHGVSRRVMGKVFRGDLFSQ